MILSTLCYLKRDGRILLLLRDRKERDANAGKWIGIGGKFGEGESPEECLLREFREETGLTLTAYRFRGIVTFVSDEAPTEYMHLFTATAASGTLRDCDEGTLSWIPEEKTASLPQWEGDRVFLRLLKRGEPFFSLKLRYEGETLVQASLNGNPVPVRRESPDGTGRRTRRPPRSSG